MNPPSYYSANPGDRPLSLAVHLRAAAKHIQDRPGDYKWVSSASCNCGILAQHVHNCDRNGVWNLITKSNMLHEAAKVEKGRNGPWARRGYYCAQTGVKISELMRKLLDAGMTGLDFPNLEALADPVIMKIIGLKEVKLYNYTNPAHVISYMLAWASLIEANHAQPKELTDAEMDALESRPLVPVTSGMKAGVA